MYLLKPITITPADISFYNAEADSRSEWDISTTYSLGDEVQVVAEERVYRSSGDGNLGNDPTTDDGTWWVEIGRTNKFLAFDGLIEQQALRSTGRILLYIDPPETITEVALFNVSTDANEVTVKVVDSGIIFEETRNLVDTSDIIDWYTYFTTDLDTFVSDLLFTDVPAYVGTELQILIGSASATEAGVGEVCLGRAFKLGETLEGTEIGLRSFSIKEQDEFGNWTIISRAKSDPVTFEFAMPARQAARTKRLLNAVRDTPAVYYADPSLIDDYAAITFGLFQDYAIPLRHQGYSIVTLEIEGLT